MVLSGGRQFDSVAVIDGDAHIPKKDIEFLRNRAGSVMTLGDVRSAKLRRFILLETLVIRTI